MSRALLLVLVACGSSSTKQPPPAATPPVDRVAPAPAVPALAFEIAAPTDKVIGIGRGEAWSCVVRASGGVDCWGRMGIGRPEPVPRRIPGVTDAIAVANDASCVLRKTGEVACLARDRLELEALPDLSHVTQISTGESECFLHDDGGVSCGLYGATRVPGLTDAIAVTRGGMGLGCAVRRGGIVVCGPTPDRRHARPWELVQDLPPVRSFVMTVHSTNNGGCAVLPSGDVRCFVITRREDRLRADPEEELRGFDAAQFANATALSLDDPSGYVEGHPFQVNAIVGGKVVRWTTTGMKVLPDLGDAALLASGCAVRAQGSVVCWDSNIGGIAGQPTTAGRVHRAPSTVLGVGDVAQLAMTNDDAWARTQDGRLYHWGAHGQGWAIEAPLPTDAGAATAIAVTGHGDACAVAAGGAVWCWIPETGAYVKKLDGGVLSLSGHQLGVVALRKDGTCEAVQLRDVTNHNSDSDVPRLPPAAGAVALYAWSSYRDCARFADGTVACISGHTWVKAPGVAGATDLAARHQPCALIRGSLVCWDDDYDKPVTKPARAPAVTDAVAISGGDDQLCAVRARGRVTCFHGYGFEAQDPIAAGAIDVEVAPEADTGCAIMRDRTVTCWGTNTDGILGDGSVLHTDRPLGVRL